MACSASVGAPAVAGMYSAYFTEVKCILYSNPGYWYRLYRGAAEARRQALRSGAGAMKLLEEAVRRLAPASGSWPSMRDEPDGLGVRTPSAGTPHGCRRRPPRCAAGDAVL